MSLSKYEIACVTAGVPATGDPILDQIITQGLRFRAAAELRAHVPGFTAAQAIARVDELLEEFRNPKNEKNPS